MPKVMEIWELKPPGTLWTTPGLLRDSFNVFTFPFTKINCLRLCSSHVLPDISRGIQVYERRSE